MKVKGMGMTVKRDQDTVHLSTSDAYDLAVNAIRAIGYDEDDAAVIAEHIMDAALCGYTYSGLPKILNVAEAHQAALPRVKPYIVHETAVSARMDGGNSVAMLALARATDVLIKKADVSGLAVVSLGNSWISGRSAHYLEKITQAGMVGFLATSATRKVAPFGGAKAALGTNPIAFGVPADPYPLIFDMGTSAFMATELQYYQRLGTELPEGVAINSIGEATRDPADVLKGGALLPFGGHKGYGIALVMQALGLLDGCGERDSPHRSAYVMIAFKPEILYDSKEYRRHVSDLLARVKMVPLSSDATEIRIPSERALRERESRRAAGLYIPRKIHEALNLLVDTVV